MGFQQVEALYNAPHRHYHTYAHVEWMLRKLSYDWGEAYQAEYGIKDFTNEERRLLKHAIIFHDVIWEPYATDNEERSYEYFKNWSPFSADENKIIKGLIMATKKPFKPKTELEKAMIYIDWSHFSHESETYLNRVNLSIFKEYQKTPYNQYCESRDYFLKSTAPRVPDTLVGDFVSQSMADELKRGIAKSLALSKSFRPKVGLFAGSFNPFHIGHQHILKKAEEVFDKVVLIQAWNPDKSPEPEPLPKFYQDYYHTVVSVGAKPMDQIIKEIQKTEWYVDHYLIRAIRNGHDLSEEQSLMRHFKEMGVDIPMMHFLCDAEFQHISSSAIRNLKAVGHNLYRV